MEVAQETGAPNAPVGDQHLKGLVEGRWPLAWPLRRQTRDACLADTECGLAIVSGLKGARTRVHGGGCRWVEDVN